LLVADPPLLDPSAGLNQICIITANSALTQPLFDARRRTTTTAWRPKGTFGWTVLGRSRDRARFKILVALDIRLQKPMPLQLRILIDAERHIECLTVAAAGGYVGLCDKKSRRGLAEAELRGRPFREALEKVLLLPVSPSVNLAPTMWRLLWRRPGHPVRYLKLPT
jgi:hypothetical protein